MVRERVIDYVRSMLQKGYSASVIKDAMLKYGYTSKDIEDALSAVYHPTIRHEIHLSSATILVLVFIFLSLIGVSYFYFYIPNYSAKLLDLNLEPVKTTVKAGENIVFIKELLNLGSSKRYDVVVKQEIIDPLALKIITEKTETRAIETFGSTQTKLLVPDDTKVGDYILRVIIDYDGKRAVATLPVKITVSFEEGTCSDGIKNQDEENVDCSGVCQPCEQQVVECNDNDPCTDGILKNGICANEPIIPCCGNNVCEAGEQGCALDCPVEEPPKDVTPIGTIDEIREIAKTDPGTALKQCSQIDIPDLKDTCISKVGEVQRSKDYCIQIRNERTKDLCYSNIAKSVNDNKICEEILTDGIRDSCYMTFVLDNKDYSVCDKITNKQLSQSCEYLRQLNEISK